MSRAQASSVAISQAIIGRRLYPIIPGGPEDLAGIVDADIANYHLPYGDVLRYENNTLPNVTDMQPAIQMALDSVPDGGGVITIDEPGIYLLATTKVNPYQAGHKTCLDATKAGTKLIIGPGVILKLANGMQTDAGGPVDILVWSSLDDITITGGGRITGNTAGQAGWTGGYAQRTNGVIIKFYAPTAAADILIANLTLDDHFSNPVDSKDGAAAVTSRVTLRDLYGHACGEGFEINDCDDVVMDRITYHDVANVCVGDGLELSRCTNFRISNVYVHSNGAGLAIDLYGSSAGIVTNFVVDGWGAGAISTGSDGANIVDDVVVSNGVIKNITAAGAILLDVAEGALMYANIHATDCTGATLMVMDDDATTRPPVRLHNVLADNCRALIIRGEREIHWDGGGDINSDQFGIDVDQNSAAEIRNIYLRNLDLRGAGIASFRVNDAAFATIKVNGVIENISIDADKFLSTASTDLTGLAVSNVTPNELIDNAAALVSDSGHLATLIRSSTNLTSFEDPTKNQTIVIEAGGSFSVINRSSGAGVDLYLAGDADFAMTTGDRLVLKYDGGGWYEVGRSVT